jgi:hypothetical protein
MTVATAAGTPDLKNAGLIPEDFADDFNVDYYDQAMIPKITTGKFYEKLLKSGDKVTIPTLPEFTFNPYKKNQKLDLDIPEGGEIEMKVNRADYFNVLVDDVDQKQSHIAIVDKYKTAAMKQRQGIETEAMFADIYNQAHAKNQGLTAGAKSGAYNLGAITAPIAVTAATVQSVLTMIRAVLEEQNAAVGKMWAVIPTWMRYLVINSDLMKINEMGNGSVSGRITGLIGSIDEIELYSSTLLHTDDEAQSTGTYIMAGNMDAISYISQMNKCEILTKTQDHFGTKLRGLNVYDWKVRKPEGLVSIYAYKGA